MAMRDKLEHIEEERLQEQDRLDAQKSAADRNKWGQFATPSTLARSIARYVIGITGRERLRFLDPAIGTGSFYSALRLEANPRTIESAVGIELDPAFAKTARELWSSSGLQVIRGDFTRQPLPEKPFNLILANPPYVRHHHLSGEDKVRLRSRVAQSLRHDISGLAGLYCYFLLLCHDWLDEDGLGVWLIPSEFMDVNYGAALRRYLTQSVTLLHIHRFSPSDVQFTDALVSSAIVVFRKTPPTPSHQVRFSLGGSIEAPRSDASVSLQTLIHANKWTHFPEEAAAERDRGPTLGDLFAIKRGLATGANSFFILNDEEVQHWQIPRDFLKPILPNPRHLQADVVTASPQGVPDVSPRLYLLDCAESEGTIEVRWPRFYEYLMKGREQKIHASYLTSRRAPWYSQEKRPPAPFLCTYMGRSNNGKGPFRFLWNRSQATAHNVYLLLYPRGPLRDVLVHHPELEADIFRALQHITPAQLISGGRVYGGGLHKVEPKELAQISAGEIIESISSYASIERQGTLFG